MPAPYRAMSPLMGPRNSIREVGHGERKEFRNLRVVLERKREGFQIFNLAAPQCSHGIACATQRVFASPLTCYVDAGRGKASENQPENEGPRNI